MSGTQDTEGRIKNHVRDCDCANCANRRDATKATDSASNGCDCNLTEWLRAYAKDQVGIERQHLNEAADAIERSQDELKRYPDLGRNCSTGRHRCRGHHG